MGGCLRTIFPLVHLRLGGASEPFFLARIFPANWILTHSPIRGLSCVAGLRGWASPLLEGCGSHFALGDGDNALSCLQPRLLSAQVLMRFKKCDPRRATCLTGLLFEGASLEL